MGRRESRPDRHYPVALPQQPAYRHLELPAGRFPVAEKSTGEVLSLPIFPELGEVRARRIAGEVCRYARSRGW